MIFSVRMEEIKQFIITDLLHLIGKICEKVCGGITSEKFIASIRR